MSSLISGHNWFKYSSSLAIEVSYLIHIVLSFLAFFHELFYLNKKRKCVFNFSVSLRLEHVVNQAAITLPFFLPCNFL